MSINIFYYEKCTFEYDYFRNVIFKDENYNCKINWVNYNDDNINIFTKYVKGTNILITNPLITKKNLGIIQILIEPKMIFFLSDEMLKFKDFYNIINVPYFYQYNNYDFYGNNLQIPLGYATGYMNNKINIDIDDIIKNKVYDFSFVGEIKGERDLMINTFKKHFVKNFVSIGNTNWTNINKLRINPSDVYELYLKSYFVPIGRGNYSYDCFRFYEAIMSNSIPVLVGDIDKIKKAYEFNGLQPMYIVADTWEIACEICKNILKNEKMFKTIIIFNNNWWQGINNKIIERINMLIQ